MKSKYLCVQLDESLRRHLEKYALLTHKSLVQIAIEAIKHETNYGKIRLAVKAFPIPTEINSPEDLELVVG